MLEVNYERLDLCIWYYLFGICIFQLVWFRNFVTLRGLVLLCQIGLVVACFVVFCLLVWGFCLFCVYLFVCFCLVDIFVLFFGWLGFVSFVCFLFFLCRLHIVSFNYFYLHSELKIQND